MSRIKDFSDHALEQALELIHQAGSGIRTAGHNIKDVGSNAGHLIQSGAAISAAKAGTQAAGKFVRRNPSAVAAIAVAGVGLLAYAVFRKRKKDKETPIETGAKRLNTRLQRSNVGKRARAVKKAVARKIEEA